MNNVLIQSCIRVSKERFLPVHDARTVSDFDTGGGNDIPGVVRLEVYGVPVVGYEMWDEINEMWPGMVDALYDCVTSGRGEYYFPSRAITLKMRYIDRLQGINMWIGSGSNGPRLSKGMMAPAKELVNAAERDGQLFVDNISRFTVRDYDPYLNRLKDISSTL